MFRKVLVGLLIVAVLISLVVWRMALTLNVGSGAVALVQNGGVAPFVGTPIGGGPVAMSWTTPSTAGTALVAIVANASIGAGLVTVSSFPPGWVKLASEFETTQSDIEVWVYPNNPGGISAVTFQTTVTGAWYTSFSEWANVVSASSFDSSGVNNAVAGTTLVLTTTGNVAGTGDLAFAAWIQKMTSGTTTFTTPPGWTRLADNGTVSFTNHLDIEYRINPAPGAPLAATLTSTGTTNPTASGVILTLKAAPPVTDQTAFIRYGSLAVKLNTLDCQLIDPATVPSMGDPVALTTPTWNGRIVSLTKADLVDIASGHKLITIVATNSAATGIGIGPGDFGDTAVGGYILSEDGFKILQEDGTGALLQEGTRFGYRSLSVQTSQNQDGTVTTYGTLETFEGGFAAGQTFKLYSANLGYTGDSFTITNVSQSWIGAAVTGQPTEVYLIEFGDPYQTFQLAGGGVLTQVGSTAVIQPGAAIPAGTLGYAQVITTQATFSAETDLTGLTVTVTVASGRRIRITGFATFASSVANDAIALRIYEAATQIQASALSGTGPINFGNAVAATVTRQPATGVHVYKLTGIRTAGTGVLTAPATSSLTPAYIMVEDIGT